MNDPSCACLQQQQQLGRNCGENMHLDMQMAKMQRPATDNAVQPLPTFNKATPMCDHHSAVHVLRPTASLTFRAPTPIKVTLTCMSTSLVLLQPLWRGGSGQLVDLAIHIKCVCGCALPWWQITICPPSSVDAVRGHAGVPVDQQRCHAEDARHQQRRALISAWNMA